MMTKKMHARRPFMLALTAAALCTALTFAMPFAAPEVGAVGGNCGWGWDAHTEIDYFDNPQTTGVPVGWEVFTCSCNYYTDGIKTPYYTVISETPCDL